MAVFGGVCLLNLQLAANERLTAEVPFAPSAAIKMQTLVRAK